MPRRVLRKPTGYRNGRRSAAGRSAAREEEGRQRARSARFEGSSGREPKIGPIVVSMDATPHKVIRAPHARAWSGVIFGALFVASYMALSDDYPPVPKLEDPVGVAFCLLALALTIRSLCLAVVVRSDALLIRGYLTTRKVRIGEVESLSVIDYPGPWWLSSDRLKGLRVNRSEGRSLTVWGLTGSEKRVRRARAQIEAALPALETGSRWSG